MLLAAFLEEGIDDGEIELALLGFDLFPVDGHFDGVGVHGFDGAPDAGHHVGPGAGVMGLAAEHEEGLAIDEEGVAAVLGDDFGHIVGGGWARTAVRAARMAAQARDLVKWDWVNMNSLLFSVGTAGSW